MKPSPCLSPLHIRCKDGIFRAVPCGHCAACLVNKGRKLTERLEEYLKGYTYQFFVTLTYSDENLSLARLDKENNTLYHCNDCDYDGVVYSYDLGNCSDGDIDWLNKQLDRFGGLPVLSHRDLINFKKRFRYYYNKALLENENKDLFIHAVGEYGPTTFRPHYHLIFGCKSPIDTGTFTKCINSAWSYADSDSQGELRRPLGFITCERISARGCESYCAKYINCTTHLPFILKKGKFRPFSSGSTRVNEFFIRYNQEDLSKVYSNPTFEITTSQRGKSVVKPVPSVYADRYFPLIPRFKQFSCYELCVLYRLALQYPNSSTCFSDFENKTREHERGILEYRTPFIGVETFETPPSILEKGVQYACFTDCNGKEIHDSFIRKRNFMRLWYVSRRVCENAKKLDIDVSTYVDKICEYHSKYQLTKLNRFYLYQQQLVDDAVQPLDSSYLFTLYTSTNENDCDVDYYAKQFGADSSIDIMDIPDQSEYSFLMKGILNDTTKTKKRNDYLFSRGKSKKTYVSHLPNKILKFLNH